MVIAVPIIINKVKGKYKGKGEYRLVPLRVVFLAESRCNWVRAGGTPP